MEPIYLDYQATTPCDPRVAAEMAPALSQTFGNASSEHAFGRKARRLVEEARSRAAVLLDAEPGEVIFTSGATESNNLAIKGAALARGRGHIVTSSIEHRSVLDCCAELERQGFQVTYLQPAPDGRMRVEDLEAALRPDTFLVSVMHANNEIGTVNPVGEIGALCKERGVLFHSDGVQALPYLRSSVQELGIDLAPVSAHKIYGPKGAGALYVRKRRPHVRLRPLLHGGGHEKGLRSGTLNVAGIAGLGKACELVLREREDDGRRVRALRDRLLELLLQAHPDAVVHGSLEHRLPNNLNLSFPGVRGERLAAALERVAVSSGAACSSARGGSSHVLRSLLRGRDERLAEEGSIRLSLGRFTTPGEVERAAAEISAALRRLEAAPAAAGGGCEPSP